MDKVRYKKKAFRFDGSHRVNQRGRSYFLLKNSTLKLSVSSFTTVCVLPFDSFLHTLAIKSGERGAA